MSKMHTQLQLAKLMYMHTLCTCTCILRNSGILFNFGGCWTGEAQVYWSSDGYEGNEELHGRSETDLPKRSRSIDSSAVTQYTLDNLAVLAKEKAHLLMYMYMYISITSGSTSEESKPSKHSSVHWYSSERRQEPCTHHGVC